MSCCWHYLPPAPQRTLILLHSEFEKFKQPKLPATEKHSLLIVCTEKSPSFYFIFLFLFLHSGWFLLSSSAHKNHRSLAQVLSEWIHLTVASSCLTLWYHMDSRSAKEDYKPPPFSRRTVCDNAEDALYPVHPVQFPHWLPQKVCTNVM